ncbi:DUF6766 family protein [Chelatococcus reniformis]|uniref:DUF6766 family protein n=1 Tax=Chelatococcus reniformis TaxID=1494448 RepID=UPI003570A812
MLALWLVRLRRTAESAPIINSIVGLAVQLARETLENWQSEFLQLLLQIGGPALLLYVGSPQSKKGDDRMEAKIDAIRGRGARQSGSAHQRDRSRLRWATYGRTPDRHGERAPERRTAWGSAITQLIPL